MQLDERFRPAERLRRKADFDRVFASRRSAADDVLVVYVADNGLAFSRLGVSVSKRIGNAVRRHYVRRRVREAFRRNKRELSAGLDIVCVAKPPAANRRVDVAGALLALAARAASRPSAVRTPKGR